MLQTKEKIKVEKYQQSLLYLLYNLWMYILHVTKVISKGACRRGARAGTPGLQEVPTQSHPDTRASAHPTDSRPHATHGGGHPLPCALCRAGTGQLTRDFLYHFVDFLQEHFLYKHQVVQKVGCEIMFKRTNLPNGIGVLG